MQSFTSAHWLRWLPSSIVHKAPTIQALLVSLLQAYASVLFCRHPAIGFGFMITTLVFSPAAGLCGLLSVVLALIWGRLLSLSGPAQFMNSLLCGLVLGAFHGAHITVFVWIFFTTLIITLLSALITNIAWTNGRLPILSLPFVFSSWLVLLTTQANPAANMPTVAFTPDGSSFLFPWIDQFFTSLGWLLLVPFPLAGAVLFAGMLMTSRYMAFLALMGYGVGELTLLFFERYDAILVGYNFVLVAVVLGGYFIIPSLASFVVAIAGCVICALMTIALGYFAYPIQLPVLTLPSVLTLYLWLGSLRTRTTHPLSYLALSPEPGIPDISYEAIRLSRCRMGALGAVSLSPPFYGEWRVTQGFNGPHTHRVPWQHALDFEIMEADLNHREDGSQKHHFYCFGAPVLAPISGYVYNLRHDLPDLEPGDTDVINNWGNFLMIRTVSGHFVMLAHLLQHSLLVRLGEWVTVGQMVASCGSSGRSFMPHLHLQVQVDPALGSPTVPFYFSNILLRKALTQSTKAVINNTVKTPNTPYQRQFKLHDLPTTNDYVSYAPSDTGLYYAVLAPIGLMRYYDFRPLSYGFFRSNINHKRALMATLTLLGQKRLVSYKQEQSNKAVGDCVISNSHPTTTMVASSAYEETHAVLAYYNRQGRRDAFLDMWLLALGLTPFSANAESWFDRPSSTLMPMSSAWRLWCAFVYPLGAGCESHYQRHWDEQQWAWIQNGLHHFYPIPWLRAFVITVKTTAWIAPQSGVRQIQLEKNGHIARIVLNSQHSDIPAPTTTEALASS